MGRTARLALGVAVVAAVIGVLLGTLAGELLPTPTTSRARPAVGSAPQILSPETESDAGDVRRRSADDLRMTPIPPEDESGTAALAGGRRADGQPLRPSLTTEGILHVAALADPAYRARHADWQERIERRIEDADRLLREGGGIRIRLVGRPAAWTPLSAAEDIRELLVAVTADAPDIEEATGARFVLCVASRPSRSTLDYKQDSLCGLSRMFSDCAVVVEFEDVPAVHEIHGVTIAHEIAHCFGCFHYPDPRDVMVPKLSTVLPDRFSTPNKQVFRLTRGIDLSAGERGLPENVLVRVAELARDNMAPGEHNSAADQISLRAYRLLLEDEDYSEGVRLCRLALGFEPRAAGTRVNLAYGLYRLGDIASARAQLDTALRVDPSLGAVPNVRQLRRALRAPDGEDGGEPASS